MELGLQELLIIYTRSEILEELCAVCHGVRLLICSLTAHWSRCYYISLDLTLLNYFSFINYQGTQKLFP